MFNFINIEQQLSKMLIKDNDPLNKARAKFLIHGAIACLFIALLILPSTYLSGETPLLIRVIVVIFLLIGVIYTLLFTSKWKIGAHSACIALIIIIWSNLFFFIKGVNILSVQFTLLLIVLSYYLLGAKWGIFYSALVVITMVFYLSFRGQDHIFTQVKAMEVDSFTFSIVFSFNFLLIIYLQYNFINSFNNNLYQLGEKQKEEKLLNEKLKDALILAEESAITKSHFLSTISHELRTPLNAVIGMSDILLLDNPRTDQSENLTILKFSANNLLNLINNVLDFNKIESKKIEIEYIPFKIYDLIKSIYNGFKSKTDKKSLEFTLDADEQLKEVYVIGDPTRLTQIISNLIENAIKFTAEGEVSVRIKTISRTKDAIKLHFCIRDTGVGIPENKQEIIFDSFTQSSSSITRKYGGTGLGLTIVKNLLALMGSKIFTTSEVGVGTDFTFDLNYKICQINPEKKNGDNETIDLSKLRILIAEDNEMNTLLMKKLLATWKITPHFAANGAEAVAAFENNDFDLVLMDIHMPVMDGYEAAITIRQFSDEKKAKVKIIALTASVAMDARKKVAASGMDDYMSKPFNPSELREKLESVMIKNL